MKDIVIIIGQRISKIRKQKNISLEILSKKARLSLISLKQIEKGLGDPPAHTIYKIAAALNIKADQLSKKI